MKKLIELSAYKVGVTKQGIFQADILDQWPISIQKLDAIITSPPFLIAHVTA